MTFSEKVRELVAAAEADADFASELDSMASAYMEQFSQWPCSTQVSLGRIAHIVASLAMEPNARIRRIRATDGMELRSQLG